MTSADDSATAAQPAEVTPGTEVSLHPLSPVYVPEDHDHYVQLLAAALKKPDTKNASKKSADTNAGPSDERPLNIALTGHYGSGKSSVLVEVQRQCEARAINVSLSSLGADEVELGRVREAGATPPLTNLIQKEIVKQLLYRKPPSQMRGSRYHRIDAFEESPALAWSVAAAGVTLVLGTLLKLVGRIEDVFPSDLAAHHHWIAWASLLVISAAGGGIVHGLQRALHNRFAVTNISAGPAAVSLSKKENSYFDEYLDEIVYFFQRSEVDVVIFEDLDRFKDPHIFETLRELNTVLNNAEQITNRPIQFVYAIRDSVFEQLKVADGDDDNSASTGWQVSASSNRTKFFDLVVPMVPFISHRTSRDLLRGEFKDVAPAPSEKVMDLVASYLTDMRLIKNIRNEYLVYARQVLPPKGLDGLGADQLFAMTVYKNLYMEDYERIREATSAIDKVMQTSRLLVEEQATAVQRRANTARRGLSRADGMVLQASALGRRISEAMPVAVVNWLEPQATYRVGSENFSPAQVGDPAFWTAVAAAGQVTVTPQAYQQPRSFRVAELEALLGIKINADSWTEEARAKHQAALDAELALLDFLTRATTAELIARDDLELTAGDGSVTLAAFATKVLPSTLAYALMREGYIDENYILYVTSFAGVAVSPSAMNFILHCVQRDKANYRYKFGTPSDIDKVVDEEGERFLHGPAAFNVEVFDHLLDQEPPRLGHAISALAVEDAPHAGFVDVYLDSGAKPTALIGQLAPHWPGVFNYLANRDDPSDEAGRALLNAAVQGVDTSTNYILEPDARALIESTCTQLEVFTAPIGRRQAQTIANFLAKHALSVSDITDVPETLRGELVRRGSYPLTVANLRAATGADLLALDRLKSNDDVYRYVLDHLDDYLTQIPEDQPTAESNQGLVDVINDVLTRPDAAATVEALARRAAAGCEVEDLQTLGVQAWQAVTRTGQLKPTFGNVAAYAEHYGVDDALVSFLEGVDELGDPDSDNDARERLALALINQPALTAQVRLRLTRRLGLSDYLDPAAIRDEAIDLIPDLVAQDDIQDNATAWQRLEEFDWKTKERLIAASNEFDGYSSELTLTSDDLAGIANSRALPDATKALLIDHLDDLIDEMGQSTVDAVARLAARTGRTLSAEQVARLAAGGARPDAVIECLTPLLPSLTRQQAATIIGALPQPYVRLTQTGARPIHVPTSATALVERLKTLDFVTSSGPDRKRGDLKVYTRRR